MLLFCSFWLVPSPFSSFLFSFSCCDFVLLCCSCFNYIFIFPNIFFIFLILFYFLFFVIVLLLSFLLLHHTTCGILVPRPGIGPELMWWERRVQTTGLIENLRHQGILIGVRAPRGPHPSTKPSSTQQPENSRAGCLRPNNQ